MRFAGRFLTVGLLTTILTSGFALADPPSQAGTREAYALAIKCHVANSVASFERRDAGDKAGEDSYKAKSQRAFDGAVKLGQMLGLTNREINHDLDVAQEQDLPKMVRDRAYFLDTVGTCKGAGLM